LTFAAVFDRRINLINFEKNGNPGSQKIVDRLKKTTDIFENQMKM